MGGSVSTSLLSIVLVFSIVNKLNLFTGNWGTLIVGHVDRDQREFDLKTKVITNENMKDL